MHRARCVGKNRKESIGIEPRGLSVPQAAAYYGISPNAYRRLMREGKVPQPIKLPGLDRQIIDKLQLDAALDKLSGIGRESIVPDDPTWA